jgi:Ca-activated chloride channel homolog
LVTLRADRSLIRSDGRTRRHLCVELRAPEAPSRKSRLPVSLAFVIDCSGSMHGAKLAYARQAVLTGIRSLRQDDRFAVVTYDDFVVVVIPGTEATTRAQHTAAQAVERVAAGGNTNLHGGWLKGCKEIADHLASNTVARCLLLTDGLANAGETDHDEIVRQGANWRDRRVVTTTFGVGEDFDETLLRRLADAGGGNFQFIESAVQIADFVASEVGEALATTVREAVLVVDAGPGATVESINDFPCRQTEGTWRIAIGSLYSRQTITPVLRITFPEGEAGKSRDVTIRVEDQDHALADAKATAAFRWATEKENDKQPRDVSVDRLAASLDAARAERDALECNRRGDYAGAQRVIEACLARIREYAGGDPEIDAIASDFERKAFRYDRSMDSITSKTIHSTSSGILRGRWPRPSQSSPSASNSLIVPSEWDIQTAVGEALRKIASANPSLSSLDVTALAPPLSHLAKRGCLLDPSVTPDGDVELHFQSPDLCRNCRRALEAAGLQSTRIAQIAEALRLLGAPSGVVH